LDIAKEGVKKSLEIFNSDNTGDSFGALLNAYLMVEQVFIAQGHPERAERVIADEVEEINFQGEMELAILFKHHLQKLANLYYQYDFVEFAETVWNRIVGEYDGLLAQVDWKVEVEEESLEHHRIMLASKAHNGLGHLYLNQGKSEEAMAHFSLFEKEGFLFQTVSKYFETVATTLIVTPNDSSIATCQFVLEVGLNNRSIIFPGMKVRMIIESPDGTLEETAFEVVDLSLQILSLRSVVRTSVTQGQYIITAELSDETTGEIYKHRQSHFLSRNISPDTAIADLMN
jgi:hypothetical protein